MKYVFPVCGGGGGVLTPNFGRYVPRQSEEPAVESDERVEIKEILKMMVSGTAISAKKCKMVMLRNGFVGNL